MDGNKLIFIDVETTGLEEDDVICECAFTQGFGGSIIEGLFKPKKPIDIEASMVHHISNEMVADRQPFQGSAIHKMLKTYFNQGYILVAHNAEFEIKMLAKEDIHPKKAICTMKVVRHFDTEDRIKSYKLQYIRYFWNIAADARAHNAADDIIVLEKIFERLSKDVSLEEMIKITETPFLLRSLRFGKHSGIPFNMIPRDYLIWLRKQSNIDGDLLYTINYYINK